MSATVSSAGQRGGAEGGGRDAAGRFTAGNKYGPGNPFARQTAELRKVLLEVVTPEEMRQVAFTLLLLAKAGKLEATKLLFQYVLGKPAEPVDPDRLEVEEWKLSQESRVNPVAVKETVDDMPADAANVLVRHVWPASAETNYLSAAREELEAMDREDAERARAQQEPAEANGADGGGSPLPPDPSPPKRGRGGQEKGGQGAARGGRSAKPQAADGAAVGPAFQPDERQKSQAGKPDLHQGKQAPSANGGDGAKGRHRRSSGGNAPHPRPLSHKGRGAGGEAAEANGGNGARAAPGGGGIRSRRLKSP